MKQTLLLTLSAALALTLASCRKETPDQTPEPDSDPEYQAACTHDSLIFVPAQEATEMECGCIGHYYCPQCSKYFTDMGCTTEIESPIIWGTSLVFGAQDYYDFFDEAWDECGYRELMEKASQSNFIFSSILSGILINVASNIINKLFEFKNDKFYEVYTRIADNLSKIESAIVGLSQMFQDEKIKDALNEREQSLFYARNATHPYFKTVMRQVSRHKDLSEISKESMDTIRAAVNEWYSRGIYNGVTYEDCYIRMNELLHFYNGYWTSSKAIPGLYDEMAVKSTPWYHQALEVRMMSRLSDIITIVEGYFMNCMFLLFNNDLATIDKLNQMNIEIKRYALVLKSYPVDCEFVSDSLYTRWIWKCKAENNLSRYKLRRDMWHFRKDGKDVIDEKLDELVRNRTSWNSQQVFDDVYNKSSDNDNQHGLTKAEQDCIYQYYRKTNADDYYSMLGKAGFRGVTPYDNKGRMVCYNKERNYDKSDVCQYADVTDRWLFFRCSPDNGQIAFWQVLDRKFKLLKNDKKNYEFTTPYSTNMNWSFSYGEQPRHPNELKAKGRKSDFDFEAVVCLRDTLPPFEL